MKELNRGETFQEMKRGVEAADRVMRVAETLFRFGNMRPENEHDERGFLKVGGMLAELLERYDWIDHSDKELYI